MRNLIGLVALAAACSSTSTVEWEEPLPGTVLLLDGEPTAFSATTGNDARGTRTPHVADAVLDQGVIYASTGIGVGGGWGGPGPTILVSRDLGGTWEKHEFPQPSINTAPDTASTFFGLHVVDGKLTASAREMRLFDLDLATNTYTSDQDDADRRTAVSLKAVGGKIAGIGRIPSSDGVSEYFSYDVNTRATTRRIEAGGAPYTSSIDGEEFVGWAVEDARTGGMCRTSFQPGAQPSSATTCLTDAFLPPWLESTYREAITSRGVLGMGKVGDRAVAFELDGDRLRFFDLGVGTFVVPPYLQPKFGPFVHVGDRLLDVKADGTVDEIGVPRSPCAHDDRCGTETELLFLLPLDGGRWGAFWRTNHGATESGEDARGHTTIVSNHERLWFRVVTISRTPVPQTLPAVTGKFPRYPESMEATPIERTCTLARMCWDRWVKRVLRPPQLEACEWHWSKVRVAPGQADPALATFLSTPDGDCDALAANWPLLGNMGTPNCSQGKCRGNLALRECANISGFGILVSKAVDCAETGMSCREFGGGAHCLPAATPAGSLPECGSCNAGQVAVSCSQGVVRDASSCDAIGATCSEGACVFECSAAAECRDTVELRCSAAAPAGPIRDCAANGADCLDGHCRPAATSEQCATGEFKPCVGTNRLWCVDGRLHAVDCADHGGQCTPAGCAFAGE